MGSAQIEFFYKRRGSNLGDLLCSPKHYIEFTANNEICVAGGGVQAGVIKAASAAEGLGREVPVILWGGGLTGSDINQSLVSNLQLAAWGIRDRRMLEDDRHFLPCVSCMHPMIDLAKHRFNGSALMYVNADPNIVSLGTLGQLRSIAKAEGFQFLTNRISERGFIESWRFASNVLTNSYHGAYWSLLAGKSVVLIGYSTKFASLFDNFGLEPSFASFKKGDQDGLVKAVVAAVRTTPISLSRADVVLEEYRTLQRKFADELVEKGLIFSWKEKERSAPYVLSERQGIEWYRICRTYASVSAKRFARSVREKVRAVGPGS